MANTATAAAPDKKATATQPASAGGSVGNQMAAARAARQNRNDHETTDREKYYIQSLRQAAKGCKMLVRQIESGQGCPVEAIQAACGINAAVAGSLSDDE